MRRRTYYRGTHAKRYEAVRRGKLWKLEHGAVGDFVDTLPVGSRVLDVPVGTGRFLPIYESAGMDAVGVDVSEDMLAEARGKGTGAELQAGDIYALDFPNEHFDAVVCFRIFNWMDLEEAERAVREMARVCRGRLAMSVTLAPEGRTTRSDQSVHPEAAWAEMLDRAGVKVLEEVPIREPKRHSYRMQVVRPC